MSFIYIYLCSVNGNKKQKNVSFYFGNIAANKFKFFYNVNNNHNNKQSKNKKS